MPSTTGRSAPSLVTAVVAAALVLWPASSLEGQAAPGLRSALPDAGVVREWDDPALLPPGDPWLRAGVGGGDDTQSVETLVAGVEGGVRLLPWLALELEAVREERRSADVTERLVAARAVTGVRWPRTSLEGLLWGGGFRRSAADLGDWTGGAAVRYGGPAGLALEAEGERNAYLSTRASLLDSLTATSYRVTVARESEDGWAGMISYADARLSDDGRIEEARLEVLTPRFGGMLDAVRLGYELRAADSEASTYTARMPWSWLDDARLEGWYAGAYTPERILAHSLLARVRLRDRGRLRASLEGAWGFHASEDRPALFPALPGSPEAGIDLQFQRRSYTPWSAGGRLEISVRTGWELRVRGGYRETAFREGASLEVDWIMGGGVR